MKADRQDALSMGLILIGIGVLFLLPGVGFWPWILVVVALGSVPTALKRGGSWWAWQSVFWLLGLAILFSLGMIWPGILILAGISTLLGALSRDQQQPTSVTPPHLDREPEIDDTFAYGEPVDLEPLDPNPPLYDDLSPLEPLVGEDELVARDEDTDAEDELTHNGTRRL